MICDTIVNDFCFRSFKKQLNQECFVEITFNQYFNAYTCLKECKTNSSYCNIFLITEVLSYFTVIIPLIILFAYVATSLAGRVEQKKSSSSSCEKSSEIARRLLSPPVGEANSKKECSGLNEPDPKATSLASLGQKVLPSVEPCKILGSSSIYKFYFILKGGGVGAVNQEEYQKFKEMWTGKYSHEDVIEFDDVACTFRWKLSEKEMRALISYEENFIELSRNWDLEKYFSEKTQSCNPPLQSHEVFVHKMGRESTGCEALSYKQDPQMAAKMESNEECLESTLTLSSYFGIGKRNIAKGYTSEKRIFPSEDYQEVDTQILLKETRRVLKTIKNNEAQITIQKRNSGTDSQMISTALKNNNGIIIGERHHDRVPKEFIMNNLDRFKQEGVETLFLEHLFYDTMQTRLDNYFTLENNSLPPLLETYLLYLDDGFASSRPNYYSSPSDRIEPGFKELVVAAKKAGIRVVGIDTESSYELGTGGSRIEGMNYTAYEIMQKEKGSGKFIALVGSAHTSTFKGVPGLRELMGCPSLIIEEKYPKGSDNSSKEKKKYRELQVNLTNWHGLKSVDMFLSLALCKADDNQTVTGFCNCS